MKITVIIPVFNKSRYIERALISVLAQEYQEWEIIAVDDGSIDDSAAIVKGYLDPRIRCIRQENQGVSVARNRGIAEANTEWVAFLDADDEYLPGFLARVARFIKDHDDGNLVMISCNHRVSSRELPAYDTSAVTGITSYFDMCTGTRTPANSSACVARRSTLLEVGGFPPGQRMFEDWTCWMKLASRGSYAFVNETLSLYHDDDELRTTASTPSPESIYADAEGLLRSAHELLADPKRLKQLDRSITSYLNRFILRSAGPYLCRSRGVFMAFRLLKWYSSRAFRVADLANLFRFLKAAASSTLRPAQR